MKITLQKNGIQKRITAGFSVTMLFFGWFVPLARGMMLPAFLGACTFNLASLYYMFVINRLYAEKLISEGWVVADCDRQMAHKYWGVEQ